MKSINPSNIAHFDIDRSFASYFREKNYPFSLNYKNLSKIKNAKKLTIITIKSNSKIEKKVLNKLPSLKAIITRTIGTNHLDLPACKKHNVSVWHIPDYGAFAIAEHVFALILSHTRKIIPLREETKKGKFSWINGQGFTLKDKTIGIIGVGKTGKETAKIARGFQMKVLGFDKLKDEDFAKKYSLKYASLTYLLKSSDIISINMPLVRQTFHLIGSDQIKLMKQNSILVNVSRGEIIDTKTLVKNLAKFRYVCLDVIEGENHYNLKNPLIRKLVNSEKVCITPHIAFFTDLTTQEIARITKKNIENFLNRSHRNQVL